MKVVEVPVMPISMSMAFTSISNAPRIPYTNPKKLQVHFNMLEMGVEIGELLAGDTKRIVDGFDSAGYHYRAFIKRDGLYEGCTVILIENNPIIYILAPATEEEKEV